jgi:leucyl/phenylalanyl-tRNA---protein transferase
MIAMTPDIILKAYCLGLFPMAESRDDPHVHWIDPDWRGILPFENVHIPRSLRKTVRQRRFQVRCNTDFRSVIKACARTTPKRTDTWINTTIADLFTDLFEMGYAHSIESWDGADLVGGLYGVAIGGVFFGESMFSRANDASKVALVDLVVRLQKSGFELLDTQFTNAHLLRFGAIEIPRERYKRLLNKALAKPCQFFAGALSDAELESFLHSSTQTS